MDSWWDSTTSLPPVPASAEGQFAGKSVASAGARALPDPPSAPGKFQIPRKIEQEQTEETEEKARKEGHLFSVVSVASCSWILAPAPPTLDPDSCPLTSVAPLSFPASPLPRVSPSPQGGVSRKRSGTNVHNFKCYQHL